MLAGLPIREMHTVVAWAVAVFLCTLILFGAMCLPRMKSAAVFSFGVVSIYIISAGLTFRWLKLIVPLCGVVAIGLFALAAGLLLRLKLVPFPPVSEEKQ